MSVASPPVHLSCFGSPRLTLTDGTPLSLRSRKHLALLIYLAINQHVSISRDTLTGLLWPDVSEDAARNNLRVALADLRRVLGAELHTTRIDVQWIANSEYVLDVARFRVLLATVQAHSHATISTCPSCLLHLEDAVSLYHGEFLHGFAIHDSTAWEDWTLVEREHLHQQVLDALDTLTHATEEQADYVALARYARRQIDLEPWRESAHRHLIRGLWAMGQRAAALTQYDTCRRILYEELGIEPDAATTALAERVRHETARGQPNSTSAASSFLPQPTALPVPLTPFVGRKRELADLARMLQTPDEDTAHQSLPIRLLTLVGVGGMGKTRLALEAARAQTGRFPDGVFFVTLAPLVAASEIVSTIGLAIGIELRGDPTQSLLQSLASKRMLLVLDNFEHILDGVPLVVDLLQHAPRLCILATSRVQLHARGEHVYLVEGMDYAPGASLVTSAESAAVRLFVQTARRVQPQFRLQHTNLAAVLRICHLVGGMPLALELAASWVSTLPLETIADEIERSADFLATEWRDVPERQRSMRVVFEWSWQLLSAAEQQLFSRLSVFRGGCTREAAQEVAGASLLELTRLVRASLVRWEPPNRYVVHEVLRQFAADALAHAPEEQAMIEQRHSHFYLHYMLQREERLLLHEPHEAVAELRGEIDNIRRAWDWATVHHTHDDHNRSAYALWHFYLLIGLGTEADQTFGVAGDVVLATLANGVRGSLLTRAR